MQFYPLVLGDDPQFLLNIQGEVEIMTDKASIQATITDLSSAKDLSNKSKFIEQITDQIQSFSLNKKAYIKLIAEIDNKDLLQLIYTQGGTARARKEAYKKLKFLEFSDWWRIADDDTRHILSKFIQNESGVSLLLNEIKKIDNQELLQIIILNHSSKQVRIEAIKKLSDQNLIYKIVKHCDSYRIVSEAIKRLNDQYLLESLVIYNDDYRVILEVIKKIGNQELLQIIILNHSSKQVRIEAIKKLSDQNLLGDIIKVNTNIWIRLEAVKKIENHELLEIVAQTDSEPKVRLEAVKKIENHELLEIIAQTDSEPKIRLEAVNKIENNNEVSLRFFKSDSYYINIKILLENGESPYYLRTVYKSNFSWKMRHDMIICTRDKEWLSIVSKYDPDTRVRNMATIILERLYK